MNPLARLAELEAERALEPSDERRKAIELEIRRTAAEIRSGRVNRAVNNPI